MEKHRAQETKRPAMWDCDSSLYDSFELRSVERQLDSAIALRTYSMPHLSSDHAPRPTTAVSKKPSKISKSIQRLLRSIFRVKPAASDARSHGYDYMSDDGYYYHGLYNQYGDLTTIPEACEKDVGSPELQSVLGKSASERFGPAAAARISCA